MRTCDQEGVGGAGELRDSTPQQKSLEFKGIYGTLERAPDKRGDVVAFLYEFGHKISGSSVGLRNCIYRD